MPTLNKQLKSRRITRTMTLIALLWTITILLALYFEHKSHQKKAEQFAYHTATSQFQKDLLYRHWNSLHGGVYAPVSEKNQPNPYLDKTKVKEREVRTPSKRLLTLINPAYMLRQVYELDKSQNIGHLTSLNPIRPENKADPWETDALRRFEQGDKEVSSITQVNGQLHLRLMRPMKTEAECLVCHQHQGYKLGDIRGGLSISIPLAPYISTEEMEHELHITIILAVLLLGLLTIGYSHKQIISSFNAQQKITEELAEAKDSAETANLTKSRFLANISHELRTPLNAILGFSQLMRDATETTPAQRKTLQIINKSGEHLLQLINDVLDMVRIESGRVELAEEVFDLPALVQQCLDMMSLRAQAKGLQLQHNYIGELPRYIRADQAKLRQVLINLLGNAVKYTDQGHITLSTAANNQSKEQVLLSFKIEDSGHGISADDIRQIFDPFVQVDKHTFQQGTGLGLAISRQYIEFMGGNIRVDSIVDQGSCFYIELPIKLASPEDEANSQQRQTITGLEPGHPVYRILIVEDQHDNRLLLKQLLQPMKFEIHEALNGKEAITEFQQWHPDFIWMDRQMPVMNGLQAIRNIRNLPGGQEVKIAAITASVFKDQQHEIYEAGADDLVYKPFLLHEVLDCMQRQLGLRYRYQDNEVSTLQSATPDEKFCTELPDKLLNELRQTVFELDTQTTQASIDKIKTINPALAFELQKHLNMLNFQAIIDMMFQDN